MELRDALTLAIMVPSVSKPEGRRRGREERKGGEVEEGEREGREGEREGREGRGEGGAVKKGEDENKRRGI